MDIILDTSEYSLKGQKKTQKITNLKNLISTTNITYFLEASCKETVQLMEKT